MYFNHLLLALSTQEKDKIQIKIMKKIYLSVILLFFVITANAKIKGVEHIIVIGMDGFGAYAYQEADIPNIKNLQSKGVLSLKGRSVLPSSSATNWASALMGTSPSMHGYTEWGSRTPEIPSAITNQYNLFPTIFSIIREQKKQSVIGAVYSWEGIGYLFEKESVNFDICTKGDDDAAVDSTIAIIKKDKPLFTFIHLDQPDGAGHKYGHGSKEYFDEIKKNDERIGRIVKTVEELGIAGKTMFLILSDHGGINKGHGGKTLNEVEIIWLLSGPKIKQNYILQNPLIIYDTAPTIAEILGLKIPQAWRGKPVVECF